MNLPFSPSDVVDYHRQQLEEFGGVPGDYGDPEGKISSIFNSLDYASDIYKTPAEVASYIIYHIAKGHVFLDGNKRTAFMTGTVFLAYNRFEIDAPDDDIESFMVWVAGSDARDNENVIQRMVEWIVTRLRIILVVKRRHDD